MREQEGWISVLTGQASMSFGLMNMIVMFGKHMKRTIPIQHWTAVALPKLTRRIFRMWMV